MSVLYVTQPEAVLSKTYEAFTVALKQEDGSWKKRSVPAQTVEQVVLMVLVLIVRRYILVLLVRIDSPGFAL